MTRIVVRNAKLSAELERNAIKHAQFLLTQYPPAEVCRLIWNRFGFLTDVTKRNTLVIGTFAEIDLDDFSVMGNPELDQQPALFA